MIVNINFRPISYNFCSYLRICLTMSTYERNYLSQQVLLDRVWYHTVLRHTTETKYLLPYSVPYRYQRARLQKYVVNVADLWKNPYISTQSQYICACVCFGSNLSSLFEFSNIIYWTEFRLFSLYTFIQYDYVTYLYIKCNSDHYLCHKMDTSMVFWQASEWSIFFIFSNENISNIRKILSL